jgi:hypothetical protein
VNILLALGLLNYKINIVAAFLIAEAKAQTGYIVGKSKIVELIEDFKFTPPKYVAHPNVKNDTGELNRE